MRKGLIGSMIVALGLTVAAVSRADDYALDAVHSGVTFKIAHAGVSWTYGRFNDVSGAFRLEPADPAKAIFVLNLKTDSIDTNNKQRDDHLKAPDFFNAKQFPLITFKSTGVKVIEGGFDVTGDLQMHGVTKSIAFPLKGGKAAEFPKGVQRTGFTTDLTLKRSDFGMDKMVGPIGDDVVVSISFEGVKTAPK